MKDAVANKAFNAMRAEYRRSNLVTLIKARWDDTPLKLAQALGRDAASIYRLLPTASASIRRNVSPDFARIVEEKSGIPAYSLERSPEEFAIELQGNDLPNWSHSDAYDLTKFKDRLLWALTRQPDMQNQMSLDELCSTLGTTREYLWMIAWGKVEDSKLVLKLAQTIGFNFVWLLTGEGPQRAEIVRGMQVHQPSKTQGGGENFRFLPDDFQPRMLPLLNFASAGDYCEAIEAALAHPDDHKLIGCPFPCSPRSFWVQVRGRSMTAVEGPSYKHGDYVAFDCERLPSTGKPVIARLPTGECTMKNYEIDDDGSAFLLALNPTWENRRTPMVEGVEVCASYICRLSE